MIRFLSILVVLSFFSCKHASEDIPGKSIEKHPHDFMFMQRAYPTGEIKTEAYKEAIQWKKQQTRSTGGTWEFVGPVNIGGRITDIEIPIDQPQTYYVGAASGGIFKTTDAGASWAPIFDEQEMLSIGDIEISKNNTNVVWVGTGEVNAGGGSLAYDGDGIYKSEDGGTTWEVKGLPDIGSISKIALDPNNDNTIFVGGMGPLFRNDTNRGVYRSTDGGSTWEQKLFVSDSTGIIDMAIHPSNGNIIYAASWERIRRPQYRQYGGETSRIYRSTDGGENWAELTNGLPSLPSEKGRISIAISQSNPNVLYARYADAAGSIQGVYRTADGGDTWVEMNSAPLSNIGFHWWFRGIVVDPTDENTIYNVDFVVQKSTDGGATWSDTFSGVHVDQHALAFNASVPGEVLLGNDGGFYKSSNDGSSWIKGETLPITQFYRIYIEDPFRVYGGAQDNNTIRTLTGSANDWNAIYGGDGFQPLVDYNNSNIIYALSQYGNIGKSTNGGASFNNATAGISGSDRKNWDTPLVFDPDDSNLLYTGTQRVYKTTNGAGNWTAISPDLTNGPGGGNLNFGTIISIDVSTLDSNKIIVGTDDGNVWITQDSGANWNNVSGSLPNRWVTKVLASRLDANKFYITFSGYRYGEYEGHVYVTNNNGNNWTDISSSLPDIPVNDIVQDIEGKLFLATDIGVFGSGSGGSLWEPLTNGMPTVVVTDMHIHEPSQYLYAASYGRSIYKIDISQVILNSQAFEESSWRVFPNPASDVVTIQLPSAVEGEISIYNQLGAQLLSESFSGVSKTLSVANLPTGLYFVALTSGAKKVTKKLIVK
ncbi:MAG: T9SS type A sorting domain-containing protein [Flavobacteriaceae bacterium]|nr:T9SS type A sorting domain-containing protein [Flavobacteriaceae bacterium]